MRIIKSITAFASLLSAIAILTSGCGNSDGSLSLNQSQTAQLVKSLGTYEGKAHAQRIMGAMMTGVWTATFFQDDRGALKCKCTLRLQDEENGWGNPSTATADVKVFKGAADGLYDLKAESGFSENEPNWFVAVDGISLSNGQPKDSVTLFDMDSYQIELSRK